jgi:hypothetical protein
MLEGCPLGVAVRIARRDLKVVEDPGLLDEGVGNAHGVRELLEKPSDDVSPCLRPEMQVERRRGFLSRLLSGKAGPLIPGGSTRVLRLLQVPLGLTQPVAGAVRYDRLSRRKYIVSMGSGFDF